MVTFGWQVLVLLLKCAWIYCAGTCKVRVTQPQTTEVYAKSPNTSITCSFLTDGCPPSTPRVLWFRYLSHTHEDLCTPACTKSAKFKTSPAVNNEAVLHIYNLAVEDSAIYFCGVAFPDSKAPTSKQVGEGTTLVIRETKKYSREIPITMAVISVLLFLYIVALLILVKFFSKPKFKDTEKRDLKAKHRIGAKANGQEVCQAIAQELRKKKHFPHRRPGYLAKFFQNR